MANRLRIASILLAMSLAWSGCGRAPVNTIGSALPASSPVSTPALEPEGVTVEATSPLPSTSPTLKDELETASSPTGAPNKFQGYAEAYRAVTQAPPPQITTGPDGIPDTASLSASLADLAARIQRLKTEKDAVESTLTPLEKKQWKDYQQSLESEQ